MPTLDNGDGVRTARCSIACAASAILAPSCSSQLHSHRKTCVPRSSQPARPLPARRELVHGIHSTMPFIASTVAAVISSTRAGESGLQHKHVIWEGNETGCRLAFCALSFGTACAQLGCRSCHLCAPWWTVNNELGSANASAHVHARPARHHDRDGRTAVPHVLVVLRGEPFRNRGSRYSTGHRSGLVKGNQELLRNEQRTVNVTLDPTLVEHQAVGLRSLGGALLAPLQRLGYTLQLVAVVHHRSPFVQQQLSDLIRAHVCTAVHTVWAPRRQTQILSLLEVLEAALAVAPAATWDAVLVARYDLIFFGAFPLPPPASLAASIRVAFLMAHASPNDFVQLVPRCRLEDFMLWLAEHGQYDALHWDSGGLCPLSSLIGQRTDRAGSPDQSRTSRRYVMLLREWSGRNESAATNSSSSSSGSGSSSSTGSNSSTFEDVAVSSDPLPPCGRDSCSGDLRRGAQHTASDALQARTTALSMAMQHESVPLPSDRHVAATCHDAKLAKQEREAEEKWAALSPDARAVVESAGGEASFPFAPSPNREVKWNQPAWRLGACLSHAANAEPPSYMHLRMHPPPKAAAATTAPGHCSILEASVAAS